MKDPHGWERTAVVCGGSSQEDLNILNKMIFIHNVTKIWQTTHFCTYLPLQRVGRWWFSFFEHSLGGIWFPRRQNKLETWNLRRPQNGSKSAFHFRALSQKVILGKHQLSVLSNVENPPQKLKKKMQMKKRYLQGNVFCLDSITVTVYGTSIISLLSEI